MIRGQLLSPGEWSHLFSMTFDNHKSNFIYYECVCLFRSKKEGTKMETVKNQIKTIRCEKCGSNLYSAVGKDVYVCEKCHAGYKITVKVF